MRLTRKLSLFACTAALLSFGANAETLIVRAGRLIDVERGRTLEDQAIRIEGERITGVTAFKDAAAAGVRVIDWSGYTVATRSHGHAYASGRRYHVR